MKPLADKIRPIKIEDIVGQQHILGKNKILRRIIESKQIPNMIFYGPPGVGKTTVANIIASTTNKRFYKLNATNASVSDIKNIIDELDSLLTINVLLLYLENAQGKAVEYFLTEKTAVYNDINLKCAVCYSTSLEETKKKTLKKSY